MKKPSLRGSFDRSEMKTVGEILDIITARSGAKSDIEGLQNMSISNPPTQAELEFIRQQLVNLILRLEE